MTAGHQLLDEQGQPLALTLYKFDSCPYCVRVQRVVAQLGLAVATRDTRRDAGAQAELLRIGGKNQVPCLLINGTPLYESADIIAFLRARPRRPL